MKIPLRQSLIEICELCEVQSETVTQFIELEWIQPIDKDHMMFDEEDVARIRLIKDLREVFAVNDEGVEIILHLVDQINVIHLKRNQS